MSRTDRLQALKALLSPHRVMPFDRLQSERDVPGVGAVAGSGTQRSALNPADALRVGNFVQAHPVSLSGRTLHSTHRNDEG